MEILSREMIKPSKPTPNHLRNHKLSLLDQLAPQNNMPLIFFYQLGNRTDVHRTQISQQLKQSLSNTLNLYYPFAGRINIGSNSVDCNDAGVEYIETRVRAHQIAQVIQEPSLEELRHYLPKQEYNQETNYNGTGGGEIIIPLAIQVNFFACGGIAIGACLSHKIADGYSVAAFMNAWAVTCSGSDEDSEEVAKPIFDWTGYFPPRDMSGFEASPNTSSTTATTTATAGIADEKLVVKRFVFDKEKLVILKKAIIVNSNDAGAQVVKDPTRVEAVTAFIWRHFIIKAAVDDGNNINKKLSFAAIQAVNLRPRMNPPLPQHAIGNLAWHALAALSTPGDEHDDGDKRFGYHILISKLRDAISKFKSEFNNKMIQEDDSLINSRLKIAELHYNKDTEFCCFSSWCSFPFYEVDYGWGKPVWVSTAVWPYKNVVILMGTSCGEGIEAWVTISEDDVSSFDLHPNHLLSSI